MYICVYADEAVCGLLSHECGLHQLGSFSDSAQGVRSGWQRVFLLRTGRETLSGTAQVRSEKSIYAYNVLCVRNFQLQDVCM